MKKEENKQKIKGQYSVNGKEKDFELEFDLSEKQQQNIEDIGEVLENKNFLKFLKDGGKLGVKGAFKVFFLMALTVFVNLGLFFYAFISWMGGIEGSTKYILIIAVLCIAAVAYVGYSLYQYIIFSAIQAIYQNLSGLFKKLCDVIVDKAYGSIKGEKGTFSKSIDTVLNLKHIINTKYNNVPWIFRKGLILVLNRIPFMSMIASVKSDLINENKIAASTKLYSNVDGFIQESIFSSNTTAWMFWFIPVNIMVIVGLIQWFIV